MGKPTSGGAGGSGGRQRAVPPPLVVAPPAPPVNDRNITISEDGGLQDVQRMLKRRRKLSENEIGDMVGAPDGSTISIYPVAEKIYFFVRHPNIHMMDNILMREDGKLVLYNDSIMINKDAPKGMGTQIITRQVEAARQLGIGKIELEAAGSPGGNMNGYYTWPRLGFDATVRVNVLSRIPAKIKRTMRDNTMLELYRTQAGRDWWRSKGESIKMEFDTSPNSKSSQALDAYNEERKKRNG